jgi:DNA-binding NarL/FixJ family response regulator
MTVQQAAASELSVLTPALRDTLIYVGKGLSNGEIAKLIDRSVVTVDTHRAEIRKRLGMTMIEAIVLAVKAGWI